MTVVTCLADWLEEKVAFRRAGVQRNSHHPVNEYVRTRPCGLVATTLPFVQANFVRSAPSMRSRIVFTGSSERKHKLRRVGG